MEMLKTAEDATIMGKMFETMGRVEKALEVDVDILSMFKWDDEHSHDDGFTDAEISLVGPRTLEIVVATLVKKFNPLERLHAQVPRRRKE